MKYWCHDDNPKKYDDSKNEVDPKNEDNPKNEDAPKNEDINLRWIQPPKKKITPKI